MSEFEALLLPTEAKEALVLSLLDEWGVDRIRRSGDEFLMRCLMPWHDDRHPSARLNVEKLVYSCFSCQSMGGLLWLIHTVRGVSGSQAREWVISTTGLDGDDLVQFEQLIDAMMADGARRSAPVPSYSRRVLDPWAIIHPWLTDPWEDGGRGIPEANIERLELGYAEAYPMDDKGRTSERIIIPHFWRDRLVGWQSRRLWDDGTPKYLSTEDFPKDSTLYAAPEGKVAVVVESPMSVVRHIHHLPITATFGADVTDRQLRLLADYDRVILCGDNDHAGWRWVLGQRSEETGDFVPGLAERLEPYTDVEVVEYDWNVDPADMDDETMAELVWDSSVPVALWERPDALRCWACKTYHTGDCREEE